MTKLTTDDLRRPLVHVRYAVAAVDECRRSLREAVDRARSAGVSWTDLAEALDMSREAAVREYAHDGPDPSPC